MIRANRNIMDPVGWTAAVLEWSALWWIAADEDVMLPPPSQSALASHATLTLNHPHDVMVCNVYMEAVHVA